MSVKVTGPGAYSNRIMGEAGKSGQWMRLYPEPQQHHVQALTDDAHFRHANSSSQFGHETISSSSLSLPCQSDCRGLIFKIKDRETINKNTTIEVTRAWAEKIHAVTDLREDSFESVFSVQLPKNCIEKKYMYVRTYIRIYTFLLNM